MNRKIRSLTLVLAMSIAACSRGPLDQQLLSDRPRVRERALKRLEGMAPDEREKAIAPLVAALSNPDGRISNRAAEALIQLGEPAVDAMLSTLSSKDPFLRIISATILGEIGARPSDVVPALATRLKDPHPLVREEAAHALARFGPRARFAVTALDDALKDESPDVRTAAQDALRRIQGSGDEPPLFQPNT